MLYKLSKNIHVHMKLMLYFFFAMSWACKQPMVAQLQKMIATDSTQIRVGAMQYDKYLPLIQGKKVALLVNQTSMVGSNTHLADTLQKMGIAIKTIFAPEHGFRGTADAGEKVANGIDKKTGLPIVSIYGNKKKPSSDDLKDVQTVIFDIQDVGVRFYTYISTLHYLMEACAENNVPLIVLDRPNPNGHYVDGPVLKKELKSFVGMHPIPIVHGLTIGEYATMINDENWLGEGKKCALTVIQCTNYTHSSVYELPVKPSPNLPNNHAIYLYPSICFFEGTEVSVGRGTDKQFQVIGSPDYKIGDFNFTPVPMEGAKTPPHLNKPCNGYDLTTKPTPDIRNMQSLDLSYLKTIYDNYPDTSKFFLKSNFFDKLAGTTELRQQLILHKSMEEIRASWQPDLNNFKEIRKKYLLYAE
jgi:uncharacterized protein YbbC (DUF1343 family)